MISTSASEVHELNCILRLWRLAAMQPPNLVPDILEHVVSSDEPTRVEEKQNKSKKVTILEKVWTSCYKRPHRQTNKQTTQLKVPARFS
jgi:hypothetical protein